jgi:hypothetical protein
MESFFDERSEMGKKQPLCVFVISLWRKDSSILYNRATKFISIVYIIFEKVFSLKEVAVLAMLHSQLPPNLALEPPNFDRCGMPTSAFLPINDGGFGTGISVAFD